MPRASVVAWIVVMVIAWQLSAWDTYSGRHKKRPAPEKAPAGAEHQTGPPPPETEQRIIAA